MPSLISGNANLAFAVARRKVEATAEGVAVDDGNRRDRQRGELGKDRLAALETVPVRGGIPAAKLLDVGTGTERLGPGAGNHQGPRAHFSYRVERVGNLLENSEGERIEHALAIDHKDGDFVVARQAQGHQAISFARHRTGVGRSS